MGINGFKTNLSAYYKLVEFAGSPKDRHRPCSVKLPTVAMRFN